MKFGGDVKIPHMMILKNFGHPLTFSVVPP